MVNILDKEVVSFDTSQVDGTVAIGVSFIFIAYFLHPAVESAYHRVRAYRAWRAIEKRQAVEVTNYSMLAETFRGRGKWDTARIITLLLAVFSLVSWGLELSMELAYHRGDADILNRSPPITSEEDINGTITWTVMPQEDIVFQRDGSSLSNVGELSATSRYKVIKADTCRPGYVDGNIIVANWSESTSSRLHYLRDSSNATVKNLLCEAAQQPDTMNIMGNGSAPWGTGVMCESGPALETNSTTNTPPTIILNKTNEEVKEVYLIVEESSNYPSFLYSVWTANSTDDDSIELNHAFHLASTVRLAEAVITGIVHGNPSGKYSFELVRIYSEYGNQSDGDVNRAEPFGEHPTNDSVRIEELETIQCGLEVDQKAVIFLACLLVLTSVGIVWSLCLRSSIGMDIYDRDELIRAVSMSGSATRRSFNTPSAIRIFVRKEDTGSMSVVISETGDSQYGCARMFQLGSKVVEDNNPAPFATASTINQYNQGYGGAAVPVGPSTVWLEGVRTGMGRSFPGRSGNFRYPSSVVMNASPVPSNPCSLVVTPLRGPSPLASAPREGPARTGERGASVLFDSECSSSESGENEHDGMQMGGDDNLEGGGTPSVCIVAPHSRSGASAMPQGEHPPDMGGRGWVDRSVGNGVLRFLSGRTTPETDEESTPTPSFLQNRKHTSGPPQLAALS